MGVLERQKYYVTQIRKEVIGKDCAPTSVDITAGINFPEAQTKSLIIPSIEQGLRLIRIVPSAKSPSSFDIFFSDKSANQHKKRQKIGDDYFVYEKTASENKPTVIGQTNSGEKILVHVVEFQYPNPITRVLSEAPQLESAAD